MGFWQVFKLDRRAKTTIMRIVFFLLSVTAGVICFGPSVSAQNSNSISGLVFEELNFNSRFDIDEQVLAGWTINLYQEDKLINSTLTNSDGAYYFSNLTPGIYQLKVDLPTGWINVTNEKTVLNLQTDNDLVVNLANYQVIRTEKNIGPLMLIHNIETKSISDTQVIVSWFTTHPGTSLVMFDTLSRSGEQLIAPEVNFGYSSSSDLIFNNVTYHAVVINNLKPGTTYYYRVTSLPDPRQWRGANRIFSQELIFTTNGLASADSTADQPREIIGPTSQDKQQVLGDKIENDSTIQDFKPLTVTQSATGSGLTVQGQPAKVTTGEISPIQCLFYIWLLILLNLVSIIYIWYQTNRVKNQKTKKVWWICLILVLIPLILGYPECWLIGWLIITLLFNIFVLTGFKKKKLVKEDKNQGSGQPLPQ